MKKPHITIGWSFFLVALLLMPLFLIRKRNPITLLSRDYGPQIKKEIALCLHDVSAHITEKFKEAEVITSPFPYLIIQDILPPHLYEELSKRWPSAQSNDSQDTIPVVYGASECHPLDVCQKHFWRLFGEVVVNRYIKPQVAKKFLPYLSQKEGMKLTTLDFIKENVTWCFSNSRQDGLVLDRSGYAIPPHVDQLNMFAQILIYLPIEGDEYSEALGTSLYESEAAKVENIDFSGAIFRHYGESSSKIAIKLHKKVPYRPNQLVAFLQTPLAWHGVDPVPKGQVRRLYFAPLKFSPEFMEEFYKDIYPRSLVEDYFFDSKFMNSIKNKNIWDSNYNK